MVLHKKYLKMYGILFSFRLLLGCGKLFQQGKNVQHFAFSINLQCRDVFRTLSNVYIRVFCQNSSWLLGGNCFTNKPRS